MKQPPTLPSEQRRLIADAQRLVDENRAAITKAHELVELSSGVRRALTLYADQQGLADIWRRLAAAYTPQLAGLQASITALTDSLIPAVRLEHHASLPKVDQGLLAAWQIPDYFQQFAKAKLDIGSGFNPALGNAFTMFQPTWNTQVIEMMRSWPADWWSGDHWFPDNWPKDRLHRAAGMAIATGLPIVGLPSAAIITALVDAFEHGDDPGSALAAHAPQILDDLEEFAAGLDDADCATCDAVHTFRELLANYRDGRVRTIQAAAFTVAEHLYRNLTGVSKVRAKDVHQEHTVADSAEMLVSEVPWSVVMNAFASTYAMWYPDQPDVPRQLNRQASAHTPSGEQHTADNALRVLLLIANLFHLHGDMVPA